MNIKTTILLAFVSLSLISVSCKDKSDDPKGGDNTSTGNLTDTDKANLYDVIWYAQAAGGGLDLEIRTDGRFIQAQSLEGTWEWQNNGDTMNITDYQNKKFKYVFDEIKATTMKYRSDIGGDNFQTQHSYSTVK